MVDEKDTENITDSKNIAQILKERDRLDQVLKEQFKKEKTVLFTDICGYTKYTETRGDISSRAMLQRHNDIVMPQVEKHGGKIIKTIGDAVMAIFENPGAGVEAAIDIQKELDRYNSKATAADQIHVTIGLNTGDVLMDDADVFDDAVNVAARIQSKAEKDQILVSRSVYEPVCGSPDILCRYHGKAELKGKAEALELFRVEWREEDRVVVEEARVRAVGEPPRAKTRSQQDVLRLEATREGEHIKISAYEQPEGESSTIRHYDEMKVSMEGIGSRSQEIVEILNKANRRGRVTRDVLKRLREIGQVFCDELFSHNVKDMLAKTQSEYLNLTLDDQLVHVPWELLHDGRKFLCQRFNMGRTVKTRQTVIQSKARKLARPLRMLVLADPTGDLNGAYKEGTQLRDALDQEKDFINVSIRSGNVNPEFVRDKIRNFDWVHFAGHADYNSDNPAQSGWRLTSGSFLASDIQKMAGSSAMPSLIFSNACQSARTEEWVIKKDFQNEIFGLANAFVLSGVKHYIGTFWEILDEPGSQFALEFYKQLMAGATTGEAVREARLALIEAYGEETIVWGSYLLYGDPTFNYMEHIQIPEEEEEKSVQPATVAGPDVRAKEEIIDFAEEEEKAPSGKGWLAVVAVAMVLFAIILWGYPGLLREGTETYEQAVLTHYQQGRYSEALEACQTLEKKDDDLALIYLVRANIALRRGELDAAEKNFQTAVNAEKGSQSQISEAYVGLGRVASLRNQTDRAMEYYRQASEIAPDSRTGYLSQAMLLDARGNYDQAVKLFAKTQEISPNDPLIAAAARDTHKKILIRTDKERQEKIDTLVKELMERAKNPPRALDWDGWTSRPLTLWIMDLNTDGYTMQEGESRLVASGLTEAFLNKSRTRVVERAILEKLLEELKLSTSDLVSPATALSLGRIMAARLILTGKIIHSGPRTQVSVRVIETETGQVLTAASESFPAAGEATLVVDKLSKALIKKIEAQFPIRGKIEKIEGEDITLNIGSAAGVLTGDKFLISGMDIRLKIVSAGPQQSLAMMIYGEGELAEGLRVEAIAEDPASQ